MYLIYFSYAHSFFVETNDSAVDALACVPCGERIRVAAFSQVVFILVNDERPPNHGKLPFKQRDFGSRKMECAITFLRGGDVPKVSRMRIYVGTRPVVRICRVEMPATVHAVAA